MRSIFFFILLLLAPGLSSAVCTIEPLSKQLRATKIVFVATLTEAKVLRPINGLKNGKDYRIDYSFVVRQRIKGDPSLVSVVYTRNLYHDPTDDVSVDAAEELKLVPGDNVLILADGEGELQIGFCSPSRLWNEDTDEFKRFRSQQSR